MDAVAEKEVSTTPPKIGQPWPSQGGIYIGSLIKDGATHHVVIPGGTEFDINDVEWDDLVSTIAEKGEINCQNDWRAPDQRELMLAYINVPDLFDTSDYYWSSTPYGSDRAWAVDFESGYVTIITRYYECRVRPFRSIIDLTL